MYVNKIGKFLSRHGKSGGQALVEYALILVIVAILFGVTLAATGPAIGNVFSNVVYNLLGQDPRDVEILEDGRGNRDAFWATVQWVAENPPEEAPIAPNPPIPPPPGPTAGPSPTPTPITPTLTPSNTPTLGPTQTPQDIEHVAPWLDTINHREWWRVDTSIYLGGDEWLGRYFANRELTGSPIFERYNRLLGDQYRWNIDFNWPTGSGPIEGWLTDNFSVRYTRQIYVGGTNPVNVRFTTTAGDGVRLWLDYAAGCAGAVNSGGPATGSNTTSTSSCLVIDNWRDQTANTLSVVRSISPGFHVLQLDYYEATSDARVKLEINGTSSSGNLSDTALPSGPSNCNWNQSDTSRSNSQTFIWEENANNQPFPANMRCYLELRGSVDFSALTSPKLIFWDVWDQNATTTTWVEIAQYNVDPALRTWTRINLRAPNTANYNWTRNVIDLSSYVGGYATKKLALRFVMENTGSSSSTLPRWYVDDIEVRDFNNNNRFFTVCRAPQSSCGTFWNLDAPSQKADFITTGRWDLTNERARVGNSWSDSPPNNTNYDTNTEAPSTSTTPRTHYIEFNGWIDLTGAVIPDADGDDGPPQLSFFQAYDLGSRTRLELQWTRDAHDLTPDTWQSVQTLVGSSTSTQTNLTMLLKEVPLSGVTNWNTQPFRMRFAMVVPSNAGLRNGWWIDDIYLERIGRPRFADYPFSDDAENGRGKWLMEGQWSDTNEVTGVFGSENVFADTPGANFTVGTNASMSLRYPFDLNNDSPENIADATNIQTGPATRPVLSFWHWRRLRSTGQTFFVDWSKDLGLTWNTAWSYQRSSATDDQVGWERIQVDLGFLQTGTAGVGTLYDDDVLLRFRLDVRSGSAADGVYIDDIRVENYSELSHKLWDPSQNPGGYGTGDNVRYSDDVDSGNWFDRWWPGGAWAPVDYDRHSRQLSFHESGPLGVNTAHETFNVMEMRRIIDLRGVTVSDAPTLYYWNRYYVGSGDQIRVQVAAENTGYNRAAGESNYERVTGWDAWVTVGVPRGAGQRVDTWIRDQISLDTYAGRRIKIRFIYDAYSDANNQDGWYFDDVVIEQRKPTPIVLPFFDPAQSLNNWITEGTWGLAPDQWRGSGGGPAALGTNPWTGVYYDCQLVFATVRPASRNCNNTSDYNTVLYENFATNVQRAYNPARDLQELVLDVNHDFRSSGLPPGAGTDTTWRDQYTGRWTRDITVQAGDYTFISISDDGVRLKWENMPPAAACGTAAPCWNLINNWTAHGRFVDIGTVSWPAGDYRLTLEWYEASGDATIILSAGRNNFSFGDSPKGGNGPSFPVVNSIPFGNSSLILRRPVRLIGTTQPVVEYWTRYWMGGTANVEVSINGGFDWTTSNLNSSTGGWSCPSFYTCSASYSGRYPSNFGGGTPSSPENPADWQPRQNNLSSYIGSNYVSLRFRLLTTNSSSVRDGWFITDIQINAASIIPPTPVP